MEKLMLTKMISAILCLMTLTVMADTCPLQQASYQVNRALPPHQEGYLKLSGGSMYSSYINHPQAPLVILAPGIPSAVYFSDLMIRLNEAGYSVLTFDYPGKMNSDVNGKEDLEFISKQLKEAFDALNVWEHPVWHVIGTSMGGPVAAKIASTYPSYVHSLALLNPVGLKRDWTLTQKLARVPILSQLVAPLILKNEVKKNIADAMACASNYANLVSEQDQYLATVRSRLNYLNLIAHFSMKDSTETYRKLSDAKLPILVTTGQDGFDHLADQVEQLKKVLPNATYVSIPNTSHIPFIENPVETFEILQNFLKARAKSAMALPPQG
jgi:pimeloyl-ACP methyl ester carboxylesterase